MHELTVIEGGKIDVKTNTEVGTKLWATRTRRRAKELAQTLDLGYMELARILYQVFDVPVDGDPKKGPIFLSWGFSTFGEYAEQELGIHAKKAERLRKIWYLLEIELKDMDQAIKQRIVDLGFSKVRELVRVLTIRNAQQWVDTAETMSYRQLASAVKDERRRQGIDEAFLGPDTAGEGQLGPGNDDLPPELTASAPVEFLTQERFDLYPAQLENVRLALDKAQQLTGSDKKGHRLDMICLDFLATNDVLGTDSDKRLRYLAKIERVLGLKLVAIDPDAKEVVYGISSLEDLANAAREADK